MGRLDAVDLSKRLSRTESEERIVALQRRLLHLRLVCGGLVDGGRLGPPLCVVFEGWDAAGKGGAIKRLVARLDPRHVRVGEYAAPTPDEGRHHFLLRFAANVPGWGGMAVYDRSWYGRVLVERVEGLASEAEWRRAYDEIVSFERGLVEEGVSLVKFWLHISPEEQERRFLCAPERSVAAVEAHRRRLAQPREAPRVRGRGRGDVRAHRPPPGARWDIVAAENKPYARVKILRTVVERMEDGMRRWGIEPPPSTGADFDVSR